MASAGTGDLNQKIKARRKVFIASPGSGVFA
jgi:hypothetical protein